jgi:hypothetical protein
MYPQVLLFIDSLCHSHRKLNIIFISDLLDLVPCLHYYILRRCSSDGVMMHVCSDPPVN